MECFVHNSAGRDRGVVLSTLVRQEETDMRVDTMVPTAALVILFAPVFAVPACNDVDHPPLAPAADGGPDVTVPGVGITPPADIVVGSGGLFGSGGFGGGGAGGIEQFGSGGRGSGGFMVIPVGSGGIFGIGGFFGAAGTPF
jgi:hypothetical protein